MLLSGPVRLRLSGMAEVVGWTMTGDRLATTEDLALIGEGVASGAVAVVVVEDEDFEAAIVAISGEATVGVGGGEVDSTSSRAEDQICGHDIAVGQR